MIDPCPHFAPASAVAFDFETSPIRPGLQHPPPSCLSLATDGGTAGVVPSTPGALEGAIAAIFDDPGALVLAHNGAFDLGIAMTWIPGALPRIVQAFDAGRIVDTMAIQKIAEISGLAQKGSLALDALAVAHGLPQPDKDPEIRLSFGPLRGLGLEHYSARQIAYSKADAEITLELFARMHKRWLASGKINLWDCAFLSRRMFWLGWAAAYGLRTDPSRLEILERETLAALDDLRTHAQSVGLVRADRTKDMAALRRRVAIAYAVPPSGDATVLAVNGAAVTFATGAGPVTVTSGAPLTGTGAVGTSRAVLEESGDPILEDFAHYGETAAVVNKDLPMLKAGAILPIHTRFGTADTLRSTSSKPNVQNPRRRAGIRECFVPREGCCYVAIDHGGLELCTLAQVCVSRLGLRRMADRINAGADLHCDVAAQILAIDYETAIALKRAGDDALSNARNCGKVVNFGRPGGMGAETLSYYAKQSYGLTLTVADCRTLIAHWERANPDGCEFLRYVSRLPKSCVRGVTGFDVVIPGTTIARRGVPYCSAANTHFQGLGAALEAWVGWVITRETIVGVTLEGARSPLSGCRIVNFVHDEFILEVPIGRQTAVAERLGEIMRTAPKPYLPDVRIDAEAVAMARWSKKAKRKLAPSGELLIWEG